MHITFTDFTLLLFIYIKIFSHKYVILHHFGVVSFKSPASLWHRIYQPSQRYLVSFYRLVKTKDFPEKNKIIIHHQ